MNNLDDIPHMRTEVAKGLAALFFWMRGKSPTTLEKFSVSEKAQEWLIKERNNRNYHHENQCF